MIHHFESENPVTMVRGKSPARTPVKVTKASTLKKKPEKAIERKGKDMTKLKAQRKTGEKYARGKNKRSKSITLPKMDPGKPPVAKNGTYTTEQGTVYAPYVQGLNEGDRDTE